MAHALAISTSRWPSNLSPAQSFKGLPTALHRVIASYLHACEDLKVGVTEHAMQDIYPATLTHVSIQPRFFTPIHGTSDWRRTNGRPIWSNTGSPLPGSWPGCLAFDWCNIPFAEDDYEDMWQFDGEAERSIYLSDARKASLALIAGLRDGLFPNLEDFLTPGVMFLVQEVAELVELVRGGAPCARTLKRIVVSKELLARRSIKPLQAVLPHATVVRA